VTSPQRTSEIQTLETRLAARLASALAESAGALPHDLSERLRVAREGALARARSVRRRAAAGAGGHGVVGVSRGAAVLGGQVPWWQRAASVLPLVLLICGLVMVDRFATQEQVHAAAEIDALLLADDLPPAAYSDPGFAEFLRSPPPPAQ
jgi:hypothetical protein